MSPELVSIVSTTWRGLSELATIDKVYSQKGKRKETATSAITTVLLDLGLIMLLLVARRMSRRPTMPDVGSFVYFSVAFSPFSLPPAQTQWRMVKTLRTPL